MQADLILECIRDFHSTWDSDWLTSSSSDSEEDLPSVFSEKILFKRRKVLNRLQGFAEVTVPKFNDQEFKEQFHVERTTAEFLIRKVKAAHFLPEHASGMKKVGAIKAVYMTIWYLTHQHTFGHISNRFNVTKSTAHRTISLVIKYLVSISRKYINWPEDDRKMIIRDRFQQMEGLEGVLGVIDVLHINIKKPRKHTRAYCNRKSEYSILLQAVCDHEKKFTDVVCGEAGSIHDSQLLQRSSLYDKAMNGLCGDDVILGDFAYPCTKWLITPYGEEKLNKKQESFNYKHLVTITVIRKAFGLLKERFHRLKSFDNENIFFIVQCVLSAIVLHNICLMLDDVVDIDIDDGEAEEEYEEVFVKSICDITIDTSKREEIFNKLFKSE